MEAVPNGKKRVRSISVERCGLSTSGSIEAKNSSDEGVSPFMTLLHAAGKLAVSKLVQSDQTISRRVLSDSNGNGVKPGISFLLDAATSVSPAKKPRRAKPSEISDDEEITRQTSPVNLSTIVPSAEEIAEATTFRRRNALKNWYQRLRELYEYKATHHDCMVPQKYEPNPALGIVSLCCNLTCFSCVTCLTGNVCCYYVQWVNKQRMEKKHWEQGLKNSMTKYRVEALNRARFHWAIQKGDVSWENKYEELFQFYETHGHCLVPTKYTENTALGRWISTQRSQAKEWLRGEKTNMTKERYDKLCALNFQFDGTKDKGEDSTATEVEVQ